MKPILLLAFLASCAPAPDALTSHTPELDCDGRGHVRSSIIYDSTETRTSYFHDGTFIRTDTTKP